MCLFYSETTVTAFDGIWHHICVSWESSSGTWKLYKDGDLDYKGTDLKIDYEIKSGGTLVLGQEQDSVGGGFEANQSFQGMLSNVDVWDRVLLGPQIKEMSKSCLMGELNAGNVYKWTDFLRKGGARLVQPSPCKPVDIGR